MMIYTHLAAALISAVIAFLSAWTVQDWRYGAEKAERLEQDRETRRANADKADTAAEIHEEAKVEIKTEFQTIYKEVERVVEKPIYRNVCFDDDGMRLIARALSQRPTSGEPAPTLPGPDRPK